MSPMTGALKYVLVFHDCQNCVHGRAVVGITTDIVQTYYPLGIDQHIATQLSPVTAGLARSLAAENESKVLPDRCGTIQVPPASTLHAVGLVELLFGIQQHRPDQPGFLHVCQRHDVVVERNHFDSHIKCFEFGFLLSQLRQMLTAWRSSQVPMKNQQQPVPQIIRQPMNLPVCISEFKRPGLLPNRRFHDSVPPECIFLDRFYPYCCKIRICRIQLANGMPQKAAAGKRAMCILENDVRIRAVSCFRIPYPVFLCVRRLRRRVCIPLVRLASFATLTPQNVIRILRFG